MLPRLHPDRANPWIIAPLVSAPLNQLDCEFSIISRFWIDHRELSEAEARYFNP
jgi:hypothetical protein